VNFSVLKSEIFLISLAIFCQCFSYIDSCFITNSFDDVGASSSKLVIDAFIFSWFIVSSAGKIAGACFFGKCADNFSFFTVMPLMTAFSLCHSILILIIVNLGGDFSVSYNPLYLVKFLSTCLLYATMILPAMYLFDRYSSSKRILIGACIMLAYFLSRFVSYALAYYKPITDTKFFSFLAIALSCIPFFIYAHLKKRSSPVCKTELTKKYSYTSGSRAICILVGVGWNVGRLYYSHFISPYMKNIFIVENTGLILGNSLFFTAQLLFLLPAASVCKKYGTYQTLFVSLFSLAILGFLIPIFATTKSLLIASVTLFSFFSACLFIPILTILYEVFKSTKSLFETLFLFAIGSAVSKLFFILSCKHGFAAGKSLISHPTAGISAFSVCIALCFVGIYYSEFLKKIRTSQNNNSNLRST
jgi:hypothetical protein